MEPAAAPPARAVFLDRDGTLNDEIDGFLCRPEQLRLIPGVGGALARLERAGFLRIVLSNQSGVARGLFDEATLASIHDRLRTELRNSGASLDAIYYCPHHPEGVVPRYRIECLCRKPRTGLLEQAVREHAIDLGGSYLIGDDLRDVELARDSALIPILVRTGKGRRVETAAKERLGARLIVAEDLPKAVDWILERESNRSLPPGAR